MDSTLIVTIKKIVRQTVAQSKPADIIYGEVLSKSPLEVQISSKLTLDDDALHVCASAVFSAGDTVALIRAPGGQDFLLIDKVVSL